jgi:glycosyltransferase involved in cell wall biosynthesis
MRRSFRQPREVRAMPPLRLAVDARVLAEDTRGIGRYARAVLRRLVARDDVELTLLIPELFPSRRRGLYVRALGSAAFALRRRPNAGLDLIWHPANGTFVASALPSVATIHDAVPFRYADADPKRREHAQAPFLRSACTATRFVAVSQFGRSELETWLKIPAERIVVIPHGVDATFSPGPAQPLPAGLIAGGYLLFVGDPIAEPRKNFSLLYEAYRRAWPSGGAPALAVAGARAPNLPGVVHLGNLGDDLVAGGGRTLQACYRGALALTLPSYHETFGMPMLEAMACGTPVLASRASSLPEVGGDAALYLPNDDADAWATALRGIAGDDAMRARLRAAGIERAAHFDWERSALAHLELFQSVRR